MIKGLLSYFILLMLSVASLYSYGQENVIHGKVMNEKGESVPNASVFIPNSTTGTVSDGNGLFTLERIPQGKFILTISCVGYELLKSPISPEEPKDLYTFRLKIKAKQLDSVVVSRFDKAGWDKWGNAFSEAFIGNSVFAAQCKILNKDIIRFLYLPDENALRAYAYEPLLIENSALGYLLTVQLVDFIYYVPKKEVDYQVYCFFTPMKGSESELSKWKKNRERAYSYSLMYFLRSLYSNEVKNIFDIRRLAKTVNAEKKRVQQLYSDRYAAIVDSLHDKQAKERTVTRLVDKSFTKDSLSYYREVLAQEDVNDKLYPGQVKPKDILQQKDSSTMFLQFEDFLLVTNKRKKEPKEYTDFKNSMRAPVEIAPTTTPLPQFLMSDFVLTQKMPVELNKNGYVNNSNLFINGFWSWWEKMATKLPYEYEP